MSFNLDTLLLKSFAAIAETGSFSRAAEIVGRSQSAVSLQIKKLEEGLNCQLFDPGGSIRDEEVIAAANENDIAMVFTSTRHFRH